MTCHTNGPYLYNSCDEDELDTVFEVEPSKVVVLSACGIPEGVSVPVLKLVGPFKDDCWCPYSSNGATAALSESTTTMNLSSPGWYKLDLDGLPEELDECVKVTANEYESEEVGCLPGPFETPVPCPQLVDTGFTDNVTCAKVYAVVRCAGGELQFPAEIGIINPQTGKFQMSMQITPAGKPAKTCERVDVLPLQIVGPAPAKTFAELVTDALAAAPVDYPTFGPAADTDDVLAVNAIENNGGNFLLNGVETAGVNDPDGVNTANTIEVPDGCVVSFSVCLQKCLTKSEVAAL